MMEPRFRLAWSWSDLVGPFFEKPLSAPRAQESLAELESLFAAKFGYSEAVWLPYGRVAAKCFLESLESPESQVVLSAFNCVALGNAVVSAGCVPFYVDTERDSFNQNSRAFLKALSLPEARAGVVVSQWGIPADTWIEQEARKPLLHDFALRSLDTFVPSLKDTDAVLYSLGWGKPLGVLKGSMLCGKNPEQARKWRSWRVAHSRAGSYGSDFVDLAILKTAMNPLFFDLTLKASRWFGVGGRLSGREGESGVLLPSDWKLWPSPGLISLTKKRIDALDSLRAERAAQVARYHADFASVHGGRLRLPPPKTALLSHFPIRVEKRGDLRSFLLRKGIFTSDQLFSRLLPDYPQLKGQGDESLPEARKLAHTTLHLPLYSGLDPIKQKKIAETVLEWETAP